MNAAIVLQMMGGLGLFLYGMKVMSEALQKMAGPQLRHILGAMTGNRPAGKASGGILLSTTTGRAWNRNT